MNHDIKEDEYYKEKNLDKYLKMIKVEGGEFLNSESKKIKVNDIEVSKYLISESLFSNILNLNIVTFPHLPVVHFDMFKVIEFCNRLSNRYGLEEVYEVNKDIIKVRHLDLKGKLIESVDLLNADYSKTEGFRLPTISEWEWFARGGNLAIQENKFYDIKDNLLNEEQMKINNEFNEIKISPVLPNEDNFSIDQSNILDIFNCFGNVKELCIDLFEGYNSIDIYTCMYGKYDYYNKHVIEIVKFPTDLNEFNKEIGFRVVKTIK